MRGAKVNLSKSTLNNRMPLNSNILYVQKLCTDTRRISKDYRYKFTDYGKEAIEEDYIRTKVTFKQPKKDYRKSVHFKVRSSSLSRTKFRIHGIIRANYRRYEPIKGSFATLTFRKQTNSRLVADNRVKNFIRRLNRYTGKRIEYIFVPELHLSKMIHYHGVIFNMPYIPLKKLKKIYKYGSLTVTVPKNIKNISAYCSKYITKDMQKTFTKGQKRYLASRGLFYPQPEFTHSINRDKLILKECIKTPIKIIRIYAKV